MDAQDAYKDVGGRVMQEQLPSDLLILSKKVIKKSALQAVLYSTGFPPTREWRLNWILSPPTQRYACGN